MSFVHRKSVVLFHHHCSSHFRRFATKFTAKIVRSTPDGTSLFAEVQLPVLPSDNRGYPIPRRDLICKISRLLRCSSSSTDIFHDLSDYLKTLEISITAAESSEVMKCLDFPLKSLEFFSFCSSKIPNFKHDAFSYNRIIQILAKSTLPDRVALISRVVEEMERSGVKGNISTVNILIGVFEGCELEKCISFVKKWDLRFTCYTYKCLLQAHLRSRNCNEAYRVYNSMKIHGDALDIFSYNMLLDALSKNSKIEEAYMVFDDMKRKPCNPDEYTYTILIRMAGREGDTDTSLSLFQEMITKGINPNIIAYNTMLEALSKASMVDKAIFLFSKMVENGCRPNEFTYSVLLITLSSKGQLSRLVELVEISKNFMNRSIRAYLVRTLGRMGHSNAAHWLFCDMWESDDTGDRHAYTCMLESFCDAGKTTEAIDMLARIHEKGVKPDTEMYNLVLFAVGRRKETHRLYDLYQMMKNNGPLPDIFTFNILISCFGRAGSVADAVRVFNDLEKSESGPDVVSYNSLINCLGKSGDLDEAHVRFREMQERGVNPDVVTYSTLIECFGKSGKVEMACSLFDEMSSQDCHPNIVTYNILLDCLVKSGRTAQAVDLYAKLKHNGLTPDWITYSVLDSLQSGSRMKLRIRKQNPITGWVVSPL